MKSEGFSQKLRSMNCPVCQSNEVRKNGRARGKQRYVCKSCRHSFFNPSLTQDFSKDESGLDRVLLSAHEDLSLSDSIPSDSLEEGKVSEAIASQIQPPSILEEIRNIIVYELKSKLHDFGNLPPKAEPISILLLDAENLLIDTKTEEFISSICTYPIQIKIAFANWRRLNNWDEDFHKRGYQMIHVPAGKDSADAKMTAVGASIFLQYPNVKEVLICSSDWGLTHLYNHLQTFGLTVYLVREDKETKQIAVLNSKNQKVELYSLMSAQVIPSLEELVIQLEELMKSEQQLTGKPWIKLSKLSMLYQEKYNLKIIQILSIRSPGKTAKEFFFELPAFAVHQPADQEELFVTLFEVKEEETNNIAQNNYLKIGVSESLPKSEQKPEPTNKPIEEVSVETVTSFTKIKSQSDLEKAIAEIIKVLDKGDKKGFVSVSNVGTEFHRQYQEAVTKVFKRLGLTGSFIKFLQSRPSAFKVKQAGKQYQVAIASSN